MSVVVSASMLPDEDLVPLEAILRTEELQRRPSRPPDHETENRALGALVQALAESPGTILQTLADTILDVCHADSAGMSLVTKDEQQFEWAAIAGAWKPHLGGGTPRGFGPCGDVLDRDAALLFTRWEKRYPYLAAAMPLAEEGLLVPFYVHGKAAGTIWAIMHGDERRFDAEDLRLLESLGRFASAAYQAVDLQHAEEERRGALKAMQEAVEARQAVDRLNTELLASERRLKDLIAALPAAVYTTDAEGRITYYNQAAVDLAGREPTIGSDEWCVTWKLYWPDGTPLPHDQCPMALALKQKRPNSGMEALAERPDGTIVPFLPYPTPLFDGSGALIGAVNMLVDITERKAAEESLRKSEEQLAAELAATRQLQAISTELIQEQNVEALYQKLVDAAASIMRSDCASMQRLHPERGKKGELRLLAAYGFTPDAMKFWEWVCADSGCTCGEAMRTGRRAVADDVETCEFMAGTDDRTAYLEAGILAAQSTPLFSRTGRFLGMISTHWRAPYHPPESDLRRFDVLARQAADLIERAEAEATLREAQENLTAALDASNTGTFRWNPRAGEYLTFDSRLKRLFGFAPDESVRVTEDFFRKVHPDDLPRVVSAVENCRQGADFDVEYRVVLQDGSTRWLYGRAKMMRNAEGGPTDLVGACTDTTWRKREQERRELLIGELNHRVKNTLATVQSFAMQTLRNASSLAEARTTFDKRLIALSKTHDVLVREHWEGAGLREVLTGALAAYSGGAQEARFSFSGPEIRLRPRTALALSMALHELATNAVKYGALCEATGRVEVNWAIDGADRQEFEFRWVETGGPPVVAPRRHGFGSRLIEHGLSRDLAGEVQLRFERRGVICTIRAPLEEIRGG